MMSADRDVVVAAVEATAQRLERPSASRKIRAGRWSTVRDPGRTTRQQSPPGTGPPGPHDPY
jgi:hypothetical protein